MPYIYKPGKILLDEIIQKHSHYIRGKVLDVGAGNYSRYINFFDYREYIKMDVEKGENVDVVGRAEDIPFKDETFDSVVCTQVFEHLTEPFKAAKEIYRVLKKKGHCLISAPQVNEIHGEPYDYFRYTKFGLIEIFSKSGFEILECDQIGGFFTTMAQLKIRYLIDKFNLYQKKWYRLLNPPFRFFTKFMMYLDKIDKGKANRKHTIGWCLIFRK